MSTMRNFILVTAFFLRSVVGTPALFIPASIPTTALTGLAVATNEGERLYKH